MILVHGGTLPPRRLHTCGQLHGDPTSSALSSLTSTCACDQCPWPAASKPSWLGAEPSSHGHGWGSLSTSDLILVSATGHWQTFPGGECDCWMPISHLFRKVSLIFCGMPHEMSWAFYLSDHYYKFSIDHFYSFSFTFKEPSANAQCHEIYFMYLE